MGARSRLRIHQDRKTSKKVIRIINFISLNGPVEKLMHVMNILKQKDFIILQIILFMKVYLSENALR